METSHANSVVRGVFLLYAILVCAFLKLSSLASKGFSGSSLASACALFILIGWIQFALSNALHEGTHRNFGAPHREGLWEFLAVLPLGFTTDYRRLHLDHHAYFGIPSMDPDHSTYSNPPRGKMGWLMFVLLTLTGLPAILQFLTKESSGSIGSQLPRLMIFQVGLALAISAILPWWGYFAFWILPLITIAKLFSSLRLMAEHGSADGHKVMRSFNGPGAGFLGLFGFTHHAEHHWRMQIPAKDLDQLTSTLPSEVQGARVERFQGSHLTFLASQNLGSRPA
ncbi:MAG: fatty acid desaturase [Planctomycetota bacterium]